MRLVCFLIGVAAFAQTRDSIDKQLKSAAQQREMVRSMLPVLPPLRPPAAPDCDPLPEEQVSPLIESAAKARQLPARLLRAVIERESGFRACAVSDKGAQGLMQVMPATAEQYKVQDVFDPKENISAGAAFLRALLEKYKGDLPLALAAYNAGPEIVDKTSAIPDIPETRAYVEAIVDKIGMKNIELTPMPAETVKPIPPIPNP
jgi:soluble lytic murein transglycosylase-like protein